MDQFVGLRRGAGILEAPLRGAVAGRVSSGMERVQKVDTEIVVNGKCYIEKPDPTAERYVITRPGKASSPFCGVLIAHPSAEHVVLRDARRIWGWEGGPKTLSHLATGSLPDQANSQFCPPVPMAEITDCCEILDCTPGARVNLESVPSW